MTQQQLNFIHTRNTTTMCTAHTIGSPFLRLMYLRCLDISCLVSEVYLFPITLPHSRAIGAFGKYYPGDSSLCLPLLYSDLYEIQREGSHVL